MDPPPPPTRGNLLAGGRRRFLLRLLSDLDDGRQLSYNQATPKLTTRLAVAQYFPCGRGPSVSRGARMGYAWVTHGCSLCLPATAAVPGLCGGSDGKHVLAESWMGMDAAYTRLSYQ